MSEAANRELVPLREHDTFIDHVGPVRIRAEGGEAWLALDVARQHTNPNGGTHGGMLLTLLDLVQGLSVQSSLTAGGVRLAGHPTTVQMGCQFIAAAKQGERLEGWARVERATRTLSFVSGRLTVGDRLVATGTAVFRNPPPATQE